MKRRTKTKKPVGTRPAEKKPGTGKFCLPTGIRGCSKPILVLVAVGVFAIFFLATVVLATKWLDHKGRGSWEKSGKGKGMESAASFEKRIAGLEKEISDLKKEKSAATTTPDDANSSKSSEDFERAVNEKDFAKISELMAVKVFYVVDASDCCGDITKNEASGNLKNYIRDVESFNFDQEQQVVKQMKVNLAGTFAKYTIGIADNRMALSYHLDKQGKVDDIFLSASHLMYDLE